MLRNILCIIFTLILLSTPLFAQQVITGTVSKIVDGRTFELYGNRNSASTVQLQHIEVPDPDQPLHAVVRGHLEKLILNKAVKVQFSRMFNGKFVGRVLLDGVDVSQQMLRDGAAWYAVLDKSLHNEVDAGTYQNTEAQAKNEKLGVWGQPGMKPVWEFRADIEAKRKEAEEKARKAEEEKYAEQSRQLAIKTAPLPPSPASLPENFPNASYINAEASVPKGMVVVGVGYVNNNKEKLFKVVKKPETGDLVCTGYEVPSTYVITRIGISKFCPTGGYGNNSSYINDRSVIARSMTNDALAKAALAYRMYRVSGNYNEFEVKAEAAISAINQAVQYLPQGNLQSYLFYVSQGYSDCLMVRRARRTDYGNGLSGSALLALNDKYGLGNTRESIIDDAIFDVTITNLNKALEEVKRLGIQ